VAKQYRYSTWFPLAHLYEWLYFAPFSQSFGTHAFCDLARVALDPSNNRMWVWALLRALVKLFDHNRLFPCLSPVEDNGNLTRLVDYAYDLDTLLTKKATICLLTANHTDEEVLDIVSNHVLSTVTGCQCHAAPNIPFDIVDRNRLKLRRSTGVDSSAEFP